MGTRGLVGARDFEKPLKSREVRKDLVGSGRSSIRCLKAMAERSFLREEVESPAECLSVRKRARWWTGTGRENGRQWRFRKFSSDDHALAYERRVELA